VSTKRASHVCFRSRWQTQVAIVVGDDDFEALLEGVDSSNIQM